MWSDSIFDDKMYIPQVNDQFKPKQGQEFQTLDDVEEFYNRYAKEGGFSVRRHCSRKSKDNIEILRKEFVCQKEGKSNSKEKNQQETRPWLVGENCKAANLEGENPKKRRRGLIREGCKARIAVVKSKSGTYVLTVFVEAHNHNLTSQDRVHFLRSHREVSSIHKLLSQQLSSVNVPTHQQFDILGVQAGGLENVGCTKQDLYNYNRDQRLTTKGYDADMLLAHFELEQEKNSSFIFKIESDDEHRITRFFWADATSRCSYKSYGDVVIFDTTYNTNRYGMIFAPLMGVNNHGQTIIFACALLSNESTDSFVWLFKQFLNAMPSNAPKMIITDQDPAMTKAIVEAFPQTFHRFCSWHILNKFSEKLDTVKYTDYFHDFQKCIWNSDSKDEFDSKWVEVVEKSGLNDNRWLHSMFEIRSTWVPAYVNHVFSAGMSSSQRAESSHSFYKRYILKNCSLVDFMIKFNRGILHQRHEELRADHVDINEKPKLKLPHDMEKQMADVYTRSNFWLFQDELWESFNYKLELLSENSSHYVYKVFKKNDGKCKVREINYKKCLDFASCSCKKFESFGIPCRHILAYLIKIHDVDFLPSQYILKRWTKSAKFEVVLDFNGAEIIDNKDLLSRRARLFQCAAQVIDKVLVSEEASNQFLDALDALLEKVQPICSAVVSEKRICSLEHRFNEPAPVRAKGCGKRLKGGKEKVKKKATEKSRRCHGCGKIGQSHDKRNCPKLLNRSPLIDSDANPTFTNLDDDSCSSTE